MHRLRQLGVEVTVTAEPGSLLAVPDTALAAAQTKGRERYEGYIEALGRRLARGHKLADEVIRDVPAQKEGSADTQSE